MLQAVAVRQIPFPKRYEVWYETFVTLRGKARQGYSSYWVPQAVGSLQREATDSPRDACSDATMSISGQCCGSTILLVVFVSRLELEDGNIKEESMSQQYQWFQYRTTVVSMIQGRCRKTKPRRDRNRKNTGFI